MRRRSRNCVLHQSRVHFLAFKKKNSVCGSRNGGILFFRLCQGRQRAFKIYQCMLTQFEFLVLVTHRVRFIFPSFCPCPYFPVTFPEIVMSYGPLNTPRFPQRVISFLIQSLHNPDHSGTDSLASWTWRKNDFNLERASNCLQ